MPKTERAAYAAPSKLTPEIVPAHAASLHPMAPLPGTRRSTERNAPGLGAHPMQIIACMLDQVSRMNRRSLERR
jgi:hypothetical protein